ncbi:MAG: hypothetical protein MI924_37435 [Chloroflexales bacterium]|nr:hypothetical protein [Chloroflexales bacterium]
MILEEIPALGPIPTPDLTAELAQRTTVLPDGCLIVRIGGLFEQAVGGIPDNEDPIADALQALRREREIELECVATLQDLAPNRVLTKNYIRRLLLF